MIGERKGGRTSQSGRSDMLLVLLGWLCYMLEFLIHLRQAGSLFVFIPMNIFKQSICHVTRLYEQQEIIKDEGSLAWGFFDRRHVADQRR